MRSGKEKTQGAPTISQKKTVQKSDRAITPSRDGRILLYGRNAVLDAVKNKNRMIHRLYKGPRLNREILDKIREVRPDLLPTGVSPEQLEATFPDKAPHQDILIEVSPLSQASLHDLAEKPGPSLFLMLDQVTDPQNVGACLRSAAALGAKGVITQDRNSPGESGALARASAGALEKLPWIRVSNLSQALDKLSTQGYWSIGLDGHGEHIIGSFDPGDRIVLVMGSEGRGLRPLVAKHCDHLARIPMTDLVESLNVSVAAAVALFSLTKSTNKSLTSISSK